MLKRTLSAEYPREETWSQRLGYGLFLCGTIGLVVAIFVVRPEVNGWTFALRLGFYYGGLTFVIYLVTQGLEDLLERIMITPHRWRVWHEIASVCMGFWLVGMGNFALGVALRHFDLNWDVFWYMQLLTVGVGFVPIVLLKLYQIQKRLRRRLREAVEINARRVEPTPEVLPEVRSVSIANGALQLDPQDFCCAESNRNYLTIHYRRDNATQSLRVRQTMTSFVDETLDEELFFRCHRAFVVNPDRVAEVAGNAQGFRLTVRGLDFAVPVSRSYVARFRARME